MQSLNGLKSLMNLNSFLARDLGLNLLSVLLQTRCQKKYNEQGYDILKRLHQNDGGKMRYERFIISYISVLAPWWMAFEILSLNQCFASQIKTFAIILKRRSHCFRWKKLNTLFWVGQKVLGAWEALMSILSIWRAVFMTGSLLNQHLIPKYLQFAICNLTIF